MSYKDPDCKHHANTVCRYEGCPHIDKTKPFKDFYGQCHRI